LARERDELRIVDDQIGTPTYAGALSQATTALLNKVMNNGGLAPAQSGIYHMTCRGVTSWYGFAKAILQQAGVSNVRLVPIPTVEFPTLAKRPAYSVLDNTKLAQHFGIQLPEWREGLHACLQEGAFVEQ
jgi:dTDP-4-dehydrorhamnose reductase